MSTEDEEKELELKDLVVQALDANGVLPKLKVWLKNSIKMPFLPKNLLWL